MCKVFESFKETIDPITKLRTAIEEIISKSERSDRYPGGPGMVFMGSFSVRADGHDRLHINYPTLYHSDEKDNKIKEAILVYVKSIDKQIKDIDISVGASNVVFKVRF